MNVIYYASPAYVDYLYRAWVDAVGQRTVTTELGIAASAGGEAGLGRLLSAVADLKGKVNSELQRKKSVSVQVEESVLDRASVLLKVLENNLPALTAQSEGLSWFSCPAKIESRRLGTDNIIEITFEIQDRIFSGVTSLEHWASASLRNNLLMACARSPSRTIQSVGVVLPLQMHSDDHEIQVQFIVVASPRK